MSKLQDVDINGISSLYINTEDAAGLHWFIVSETNVNWLTVDGGNTYTYLNDTIELSVRLRS
jgi:hypothetical protein